MEGYNPYNKGRWYRFFIESDGADYTLTNSDIEDASINGSRLRFPLGFKALDTIYDIHSIPGGTASGAQHSTYIYADGTQAINLPAKDLFDYSYIYVFGYNE